MIPTSMQSVLNNAETTQSKYLKVWEGSLSAQRQGQPVFITKFEGYGKASASETLAANWPPVMQIVGLISQESWTTIAAILYQDHMNNKQFVGKPDFLAFRAMNSQGFLDQLREKKLCLVIQLSSQTLLLSASDKASSFIGMLLPRDVIVFKPPLSSQQQQHLHMQQQQLPHMQQQQLQQQQQLSQLLQQQLQQVQQQQIFQLQQQQLPQLQQQQLSQLQSQQQLPPLQQLQHQLPQQQQMVGTGMDVQGPARSQMVSQGKVSSQGATNISGAGFMS